MEKSKETRPTSPCLFLSYSSGDRPLAQHLRDNLARYLEVFIDTKSIPGGAEWEREIDRAVRDCTIFAPIVSEASNNSRWVARETLLAVNIGVPIVPLLFSDNLPLRIVDLQFIDFRDNFEAGLSDLLSAISGHTGPLRSSAEATDRLIARAIRARLRGDLREANALVEQFVGIDIELASSAYTFWRKL
jgi:TIR domain